MMTQQRSKLSASKLPLSRLQQSWLMLALMLVCLPIWFFLPFWVAGFCLFAIGWRVRILWKGGAQPSLKITATIAILAFATDFLYYRPPIGLEPMAALLMICCCLKFLEMRRIREARTVLYLCYFIASLQLVFDQGIGHFILALGGILMTLSAQNMTERDPWQQYSLRSFSLFPLRSIGWIALVSIPLTLVIFVFAPRLPSFWTIPVSNEQAKTGVSDVMTPGSIGELTRSSELAFRVGFEGEIPDNSQLYWRALVLSDFDGQSWSNRENFVLIQDGGRTHWPERTSDPEDWYKEVRFQGRPIVYDVYQEPSGQPWLFSITAPTTAARGVGITRGLRLVHRTPVTQRIKYRVTSYPDYGMSDAMLSLLDRNRNLRLPFDFNPRTRQLAEDWAAEGGSTEQLVQRLFTVFNREHTYTLEPGSYGVDSIDEFLFDRKRGFCEHFAQTTVFFLRAAGIPARIVSGYQGGEVHPDDNYLLVRQYDAHAWAEYWQDGQGWVRADPTAAVSPTRIEYGARQFFAEEPEFLSDEVFSLNRLQDVAILNWLRLNMESINYLWISWVLGYDNDKQVDFFQGLFGELNLSYRNLLIYAVSSLAAFIALIYLVLYLQSPARRRPAAEKLFDQFRAKLVVQGLDIKPGYTPRKLIEIASADASASEVQTLCELFERHFYCDIDEEQRIKRALKEWR